MTEQAMREITEEELRERLIQEYWRALADGRYHVHREAFALMAYASEDGREIRIWNSRNGVTPFCSHIEELGEIQHTDFGGDACRPQHIPKVGDWIFVDYEPYDVIRGTKERIDRDWEVDDDGAFGFPARRTAG